jgi:prephenate dehydratase
MRVAFQGVPGAYSEAAAAELFGSDVVSVPCESFEMVFTSVEQGLCERGVLPIENSLAGSIHRNYDLLLQHNLAIVGEHHLRVEHCLIGLPGADQAEIRNVISHPQALAQCEGYLKKLGVSTSPAYDTAGSVGIVKENKDRTQAAIASRRAAELYSMSVLAQGIEDNAANYTRFLAVAREPVLPAGDAKTSIVFTLRNIPGALFKALSFFALRDIDLTKIESRPLVGKPGDYLFYIDFAGSTADHSPAHALENLAEYALTLRVLGSYLRHRLNHLNAWKEKN